MLGGFDPRSERLFFRRRRGSAAAIGLGLFAGAFALAVLQPQHEPEVAVELEPEIRDFTMEEEPELAEEPPPPVPDPEPATPRQPRPRPQIKPPDKVVTEKPAESTTNQHPQAAGSGTTGSGFMGNGKSSGNGKAPPKPAPPAPAKPAVTKPKIDPTKPIDRPEKATMPKPLPGNQPPAYPETLRDRGITGEVVLKIHIHADGTVRGAKLLRKHTSATTEEEKAEAEKLFAAAVIRAVKTWKYEPAKLDGEALSIWFPVTFPFSLTGG